jgi:hypothetical protein
MIKDMLRIMKRTGAEKITIYKTTDELVIIRMTKTDMPSKTEKYTQCAITKSLIENTNDEARVEQYITETLIAKHDGYYD